MKIRLGTRGSRLAIVQSEIVARRLRAAGHEVTLIPIVTEGDVRPVDMSAGEGAFVQPEETPAAEESIQVDHSAETILTTFGAFFLPSRRRSCTTKRP